MRAFGALLLLLAGASVPTQAAPGDGWRTARGDRSPGATWRSMVATATGRLIGVGSGAQLMISDDNGLSWTYRRITIAGVPERITLNDIAEFGVNGSLVQRRLAAIGSWLEEPDDSISRYVARTYIFLSDDNGNTWTRQPFPVATVTGTPFGEFEGINLDRLFVTAGQRLLAYGTTSVSENLIIVWNIGGLVYRSDDGLTWNRSSFELGPLYQMAAASGIGRMVAAGSATVTDSADGAGWNGYLMRDAAVSVGGTPLPTATLRRLRLEDIVWHAGTYVAQAATYVPWDPSGTIETSITDTLYSMSSAAPFGPGRNWTASVQPRRYGKMISSGGNLVRVGPGGVFNGGSNGQSWSFVSFNPVASANAVVRQGNGNWFGIGSTGTAQAGDAVWRSPDALTWTRIFDVGEDPDLVRGLGRAGGTLFACTAGNPGTLWASLDNGETWSERAAGLDGCAGRLVQRGARLLFPSGRGVHYSDDGGATWLNRRVLPGSDTGANTLALTPSGRLVLGATGRAAASGGLFYVSDDGGNNWTSRTTQTQFGDLVTDLISANGGRLIAGVAFNPPFFPKLMISDDNGESWTISTVLQTTPGLTPIAGSPPHNGIAIREFMRLPSGRLLLRGDAELLSSDDNGASWRVRMATFYTNNVRGGPWFAAIPGVGLCGDRLLAPMELRDHSSAPVLDGRFNWVLASDDFGDNWYRLPMPGNFSRPRAMLVGEQGRAVVFGSRAGVFLSDGDRGQPTPLPRYTVRAGDTLAIPIARPPLPGAINLRYSAVQDREAATGAVAIAGTDFTPTAGLLSWTAGDLTPRQILLPTLDAGVAGADRRALVQLVTDDGDLGGAGAIPVTIVNVTRNVYALYLLETDDLLLRAGGPPASFRVALGRAPTSPVTITISNPNPEAATASPGSLVFTAANWNQPQVVTVTPAAARSVAGSGAEPGRSYTLALALTATDQGYINIAMSPFPVQYRFENDLLFRSGFEF
jgi:hypothetical protein